MADAAIHCGNCQAACCRMEVLIISETGMPEHLIETSETGDRSMLRLSDGWCAALDRDTFACSRYAVRPLICREFEMGGPDCRRTSVPLSAPWIGD